MAFKRSSVRSRSAPPPFALEHQSFGWQAILSAHLEVNSRAKGVPRSLFGGVKGDYLFLFALEPPELRVASHFFPTHDMLGWNIFQERPAFAAEAAASAE